MDLLKAIDRVADILNSSDIKEIKVKDGGTSIFMTKNDTATAVATPMSHSGASAATPVASSPAPVVTNSSTSTTAETTEVAGEEIKSPMVGTFYGSPSPDAAAYVKAGQEVKKGDVLCIIEAMKIMNKIEAEKSGKIVEILAKDGDPVQFDQPLFIIE